MDLVQELTESGVFAQRPLECLAKQLNGLLVFVEARPDRFDRRSTNRHRDLQRLVRESLPGRGGQKGSTTNRLQRITERDRHH